MLLERATLGNFLVDLCTFLATQSHQDLSIIDRPKQELPLRWNFKFAFARWIAALALALVVGSSAAFAQAIDYPTRPITIIVPFGSGGPADIYARVIGKRLQDLFQQPVIIDNKPGAGAIIGTATAAKAAPDGYTLLLMSNTHTTNETLIATKPFDLLRDFAPVATLNASDLVMVVHPGIAATNLQEFIALLQSKPGQLNYASSGFGTPYHMAAELFKAMSHTNIVHIPHKGSGDARFSVIGGHTSMMLDAVTTMAPSVLAGQVRALATSGTHRSSVLPDVPTMSEAGLPGYDATIWLGLMAPTGTPQPIVDKLNAAINAFLALPTTKAAWAEQGAEPLIKSPAEFDTYLRADIKKWADVIKTAGIKSH